MTRVKPSILASFVFGPDTSSIAYLLIDGMVRYLGKVTKVTR